MISSPFFLFLLLIAISISANDESVITEYFAKNALPVSEISCLSPVIDRASDKKAVLLGEASHGTSEYYTWRKNISKRLIEEKGYSFIVVEGDWSAAMEVNKYVKHLPNAPSSAKDALGSFNRWPEWMWANQETLSLIEWMRDYNKNRPMEQRVGFYGMDLYSPEGSMKRVISFFEEFFPDKVNQVKNSYSCLLNYSDDMQQYVRAVLQGKQQQCMPKTNSVLELLKGLTLPENSSKLFYVKHDALVVLNAEKHYLSMATQGPQSWNSRVLNFKQTVEHLFNYYGDNSSAIVWAHNTHVGDARATPMASQGRENIGKLLREQYGDEAIFILGFGTNTGTVIAGTQWGSPKQLMNVPAAPQGTIENILNSIDKPKALFLFDEDVPEALLNQRGHRAKGVIYNPSNEQGNYVPTVLPRRYDAFFFIRETNALTPLD
ncbi:erythromycin esterase family protein [Chitinispirillales bacterium ANBcel5]|uniref:erythromycin esterase family protein n=1 Tax=Cellulosispirillum alkaliphilum TaxID=3039283 RepID=UPI002A5884CB|nr:erythromycin esterase family protein [Chitinispirillales bacterium ANBcel5]